VEQRAADRLSITFESFGFKDGIPGDADFVFDARALPNPYWEPGLRNLTGRDAEVVRFLEKHTDVGKLLTDIAHFVRARVPEYQPITRRHGARAAGIAGGQRRVVYIGDRLAEDCGRELPTVTPLHSRLGEAGLCGARRRPAA